MDFLVLGWKSVSSSYTKASDSFALLTTGSYEGFEKYHIYDVAGNLAEWTQEAVFLASTGHFMRRGGTAQFSGVSYPASARLYAGCDDNYTDRGFRVVLYML
jgi:formylglycine-generating enzyme required for sulfatase activity